MPSDRDNTDSADERKVYEVQRMMDEIERFLYFDEDWSEAKLNRFLTTCMPSIERISQTLKQIWALNAQGHDINSAEVKKYMREVARGYVNEWLCSMDTFTRVAAASVYRREEPVMEFKDYAPHFYISPLLGGGRFGFVRGSPGKGLGVGKTDYSCLVLEMALASGMSAITNIGFKQPVPGISRVITLSQLMRQCITNMTSGKSSLVVLDEVPQFLSRERATSKEMVNMKMVLYLLRKVSASMVVIAQRESEIPTSIIDLAAWKVRKSAKETMIYHRGNDRFVITQIPPTSLPYDTLESASFIVDLDVKAMHNAVVEAEMAAVDRGGKSQWQVILDFLNLDGSKVTAKDLRTAAKVLTVTGKMPQTEIATLLGVTQQSVSLWLKEMNVTPTKQKGG